MNRKNAILVRHAEATGQAPDAALTGKGRRQADRLARMLSGAGIDAIYTSPYRRAVETARPVSLASGLGIVLSDHLTERVLAPAPLDDWLIHLERSFQDRSYALPGGESLEDAWQRACCALTGIAAQGHTLPLIVSHGNLIAALLNQADASFGFAQWQAMTTPDVFEVTLHDARPESFRRLIIDLS